MASIFLGTDSGSSFDTVTTRFVSSYTEHARTDSEAALIATLEFGAILKAQNTLTYFDQFADDALLTPREEQDYRSTYLDLYAEFRTERSSG